MKSKEVTTHIEPRFLLWLEGSFQELLSEGMSIQARLKSISKSGGVDDVDGQLARLFGNYMKEGKIKSALNLLFHESRGKVLSLDQQVNPQSPTSGLVWEVLLKKQIQG